MLQRVNECPVFLPIFQHSTVQCSLVARADVSTNLAWRSLECCLPFEKQWHMGHKTCCSEFESSEHEDLK
jgi:hypothetical protein